jgi:hypothetical protein
LADAQRAKTQLVQRNAWKVNSTAAGQTYSAYDLRPLPRPDEAVELSKAPTRVESAAYPAHAPVYDPYGFPYRFPSYDTSVGVKVLDPVDPHSHPMPSRRTAPFSAELQSSSSTSWPSEGDMVWAVPTSTDASQRIVTRGGHIDRRQLAAVRQLPSERLAKGSNRH